MLYKPPVTIGCKDVDNVRWWRRRQLYDWDDRVDFYPNNIVSLWAMGESAHMRKRGKQTNGNDIASSSKEAWSGWETRVRTCRKLSIKIRQSTWTISSIDGWADREREKAGHRQRSQWKEELNCNKSPLNHWQKVYLLRHFLLLRRLRLPRLVRSSCRHIRRLLCVNASSGHSDVATSFVLVSF